MIVKKHFNTDLVRGKNCMFKPPPQIQMWKQWCRIGKTTDLQTDWHPVALSIHIPAVGHFRTEGSWRRWIITLLVWLLAWKCPSLTLTGYGIAGLLPRVSHHSPWVSAVNPLSWGEIQSMLRPHAPAGLEDLFLSISASRMEGMGGGSTAACTEQWQCSWRLFSFSSFHHSMSLSTHWCLAFIAKPFLSCPL